MNLKTGKGRVPVANIHEGVYQYLMVDFPSREWFDGAYKKINQENRDKYWNILIKRSQGATLDESGAMYALTRERVRQIEAKFIRKVSEQYWADTNGNLKYLEQMAFLNKEIESFLKIEKP